MAAIPLSELTGRSRDHLVPCWNGALVHRDVLAPLTELRECARQVGIDLSVASGFRDFDRQLLIWQQKVTGLRPVYSVGGDLLDRQDITDAELLGAILRWSALPGTSRHHWGTDFDVYDAAAVKSDYQLQLTLDEYSQDGPFSVLNSWLDQLIADDNCCGFFRPFAEDRGGVAPEPWHISHKLTADGYAKELDYHRFSQLLEGGCWPLSSEIRSRAEDIFHRYVEQG